MQTGSAQEEARLVARARAGDRRAFEELVRENADRLYAVILRFSADADAAEEVTQEAFLRAWRGISRFKGDSRFFTWLYRIGINEAKRRAAREPDPHASLDEGPAPDPPDWRDAPQERLERSDLRAALERAIGGLPPDQRAPLILRDIEGLSTEESAEILGLGEAAFKSRLHRARLAVRRAVQGHLTEGAG